MRTLLLIAVLLIPVPMQAQTASGTNPLAADVERLSAELNPQVVAWRRDFHRIPSSATARRGLPRSSLMN